MELKFKNKITTENKELKYKKTITSEIKELKYKKAIRSELGESFECLYYKTIAISDLDHDVFVYGIEIEKQTLNSKETSLINDITVNEKDIDELIELLVHNDVTPLTLKDIALDWVDLNSCN